MYAAHRLLAYMWRSIVTCLLLHIYCIASIEVRHWEYDRLNWLMSNEKFAAWMIPTHLFYSLAGWLTGWIWDARCALSLSASSSLFSFINGFVFFFFCCFLFCHFRHYTLTRAWSLKLVHRVNFVLSHLIYYVIQIPSLHLYLAIHCLVFFGSLPFISFLAQWFVYILYIFDW